MKKIIGITLILVGILLVSFQLASNYLYKANQKKDYTVQITADMMSENEDKPVENDYEAITNLEAINAFTKLNQIEPEFVVGQLVVPSMQRDIPISKGINDDNLMIGVATMRTDQKLGVGNFTVAGHNHRIEGSLLQGFDKMGPGVDIYATNKIKIYHYVTYETITTEADNFEYLSDEVAEKHGKPVFTMMTCALPIVEDQRVFILAELKEVVDYSEDYMGKLMPGKTN